MTRRLQAAVLGGSMLLGSAAMRAPETPPRGGQALVVPAASLRLVDVEVEGTSRYTPAEVVKVSGLVAGQRLAPGELDGVAHTLASTGLFVGVQYRYRTSGDQITVTFQVEDSTWTMPVVFDNFVWFDDAELQVALREHVPAFDGTAPADGRANAFIAAGLERLLSGRGLPGRVEAAPRTNIRTGASQILFRVTAAGNLTVCAIDIPGALGVPESDLVQAIGEIVGDEYSRAFMIDVAAGTLLGIYRQRGYWRAAFDDPASRVDDSPSCGGVRVALGVSEGRPYTWQGARWSGVAALASSDLAERLDLKTGDVADVTRIEAGLRAVATDYRAKGYLVQQASFSPQLDEARGGAVFDISVTEGPQFRMGRLTIEGVSAADAARLAGAWDLAAGDVYNASYLAEFIRQELRPRRAPTTEVRLDREALLVNVRIVAR